ncbi:MAG: hypothetical protein R3343_11325 [Nitriliruptorales bacterium]|nr:hypothetical protein [Nitriliruptorales bacterium]
MTTARVIRRGLLLGALVFAMLAGLGSPSFAGETEEFKFSPHPVQVDGQARRFFTIGFAQGQGVREEVLLVNKTAEPSTFLLYSADAREQSDGVLSIDDEHREPEGVGSWIDLPASEVTLGPHEQAIIPVTITRRSDERGIGAIVAEKVNQAGGEGFDVVFRIAIYVDARGTDDGAAGLVIDDVALTAPKAVFPRDTDVTVRFHNDSSRATDVSLDLTAVTFTGRRYPLEPSKLTLQAGEATTVTVPWTTVPGVPTIAKIEVEAVWRGGTLLASSHRQIILPLWLPILLVLVSGSFAWREREELERLVA